MVEINYRMLEALGAEPRRLELLQVLSAKPYLTKEEIARKLGLKGDYVFTLLDELHNEGWINRKGSGRKGDPFRFQIKPIEEIAAKLIID